MVPDKLEEYTEKKLYLHATDTLCESLSLLKYDLAEVHALKNIAYTLQQWKEVCLQFEIIFRFRYFAFGKVAKFEFNSLSPDPHKFFNNNLCNGNLKIRIW